MTTFSVLICTYNRPDMLALALDALVERTLEKPDQIVIVNGGDERADQVVHNYSGKSSILIDLVKTANINLATSRNIGLPHCTGEIVAMTDDDAEVFPDWVTQMKKVHAKHPEAGGVGGAVIGADSDSNLLSRVADLSVFSSPSSPAYVRTLPGVNVSYKREVLQTVGQQDETLFRGEDVDLNWRIKQVGYEIYYAPQIKVIHHHRPTFQGLVKQFFMYGRAYCRVRAKWPEMYCVYPHGLHSFRDFLKMGFFFVAVLYWPIKNGLQMKNWNDILPAIFILFLNQIAWRSGMLYEMINTLGFKSNRPVFTK